MEMATRKEVIARIEDLGLVAVIRLHDESRMDEVVEALGSADAKIIEITMTVPGAIELISRYTKEFRRDYLFGCGTVTDEATASNAIEAGAAFVVSPVLDQDVVEATISSGVAMIPAAMTFPAFPKAKPQSVCPARKQLRISRRGPPPGDPGWRSPVGRACRGRRGRPRPA